MNSPTTPSRDNADTNPFAGFTNSSDFTTGNAKALIWLSQLAGQTDVNIIERKLKDWDLDLVYPAIDGSVPIGWSFTDKPRYLVATRPGATFVAFAGTDPRDLRDWITDADDFPDGFTGIAKGFKKAADSVQNDIKNAIANAAPSTNNVFIAGHSLGAAIAAVMAWYIRLDNSGTVGAVYTFGMPRPGNTYFAGRYFKSTRGPLGTLGSVTYRLVHGEDLVPTLPPSALGFHHVGRYLCCERGGKFDPAKLISDATLDNSQPISSVAQNYLRDVSRDSILGLSPLVGMTLMAAPNRGEAFGVLGSNSPEWPPEWLQDHLSDGYISAF